MELTPSGSSIAGDPFSLLCAASLNGSMGNANATFQWLLSIDNTSTYIYTNSSVSDESQLVFDPLQHFHEGTITCQATVDNRVSTAHAHFTIAVNGNNLYI